MASKDLQPYIDLFKRMESQDVLSIVRDDPMLRKALAVWSLVTIDVSDPISWPTTPENKTNLWWWVWQRAKVDIPGFSMLVGVDHADGNTLFTRLKALRLVYPDNTVHSGAASLLSAYVARDVLSVRKAMEQQSDRTAPVRENAGPPNTLSPKLRWRVLNQDGYACKHCGQSGASGPLVVDHIIPLAEGGTNEESNLQTLCHKCNAGKGAHDHRVGENND